MKRRIAMHKDYVTRCSIGEYEKEDGKRYFTAKILGWSGFKFESKDKKECSSDLLEKTIKKVEEIKKEIEKDLNNLEKFSNLILL